MNGKTFVLQQNNSKKFFINPRILIYSIILILIIIIILFLILGKNLNTKKIECKINEETVETYSSLKKAIKNPIEIKGTTEINVITEHYCSIDFYNKDKEFISQSEKRYSEEANFDISEFSNEEFLICKIKIANSFEKLDYEISIAQKAYICIKLEQTSNSNNTTISQNNDENSSNTSPECTLILNDCYIATPQDEPNKQEICLKSSKETLFKLYDTTDNCSYVDLYFYVSDGSEDFKYRLTKEEPSIIINSLNYKGKNIIVYVESFDNTSNTIIDVNTKYLTIKFN